MSATNPEKPKGKKRGPKPERLVIDEKDAEEALDRLLGTAKPKGKKDEPEEGEGDEAK